MECGRIGLNSLVRFCSFFTGFLLLFLGSSGVHIGGEIVELDSFVRWLYAASTDTINKARPIILPSASHSLKYLFCPRLRLLHSRVFPVKHPHPHTYANESKKSKRGKKRFR
jgi:hypothetical protein